VWLTYCRGFDAIDLRGVSGMLGAFGSADTESSAIRALYLTSRIETTFLRRAYARALHVSMLVTILLVVAVGVRGHRGQRCSRALAGCLGEHAAGQEIGGFEPHQVVLADRS